MEFNIFCTNICTWRKTQAPTLIECGVNLESFFLHVILLTLLATFLRIEEMYVSLIKHIFFLLLHSVKTNIGLSAVFFRLFGINIIFLVVSHAWHNHINSSTTYEYLLTN